MQSPACQNEMATDSIEGTHVQCCPVCRSLWLAKAELQAISSQKDRVLKPNEVEAVNRLCGGGKKENLPARAHSCPVCTDQPMSTLRLIYSSPITVDVCPKGCGYWIDAEELDNAQNYTDLWQDKLEAHRDRFASLCGQVEEDQKDLLEDLESAQDAGRWRFVHALRRGLIRF